MCIIWNVLTSRKRERSQKVLVDTHTFLVVFILFYFYIYLLISTDHNIIDTFYSNKKLEHEQCLHIEYFNSHFEIHVLQKEMLSFQISEVFGFYGETVTVTTILLC